jgi:outer membrane immunogenic protein
MKKLILAYTILCSIAAAAGAADVAVLAPAYQPLPMRPLYSWTGCYVGANAGGGAAPKTWTDVNGTFGVLPGAFLGDHTARGVVGGGQLGCDYQIGSFVFGIQGLYDLTGMKANDFQPNRVFLNNSFVQSLATLTGRIGFTVAPTVLLYAKGGGAWVHDLYNVSFPNSESLVLVPGTIIVSTNTAGAFPPGTIVALGRNTSGGWTLGTGIEWAPFGGDVTV